MVFEYRILCCHVAVDVAILSSIEIFVIVITYLTGFKHPLMTCKYFNASHLERFNQPAQVSRHEMCTTNGPLLFWIIIHVFSCLLALLSISKKSPKLLSAFLIVTSLDLLMSLAYLVVLLTFIVVGEHVERVGLHQRWDLGSFEPKVQILMMFMVGIVLFKIYEMLSARRLYWYLQWKQDNMMTPRSALVKTDDNEVFEF